MKPLQFSFWDLLKPFDDRAFNLFRKEHPAETDQELFYHTQPHHAEEENPTSAISHYEPFIR